jgi:hypothetical protein
VGSRERVELAHQLAWCRPATSSEHDQDARYLEKYKKELSNAGVPDGQHELEAWTSYGRILLSANEFVYID